MSASEMKLEIKRTQWALWLLVMAVCTLIAWSVTYTKLIQIECVGAVSCPKGQSCVIWHGAKTPWNAPALFTTCAKPCGPLLGGCPNGLNCVHADPGPDDFICR
jgi:hypothetical protein